MFRLTRGVITHHNNNSSAIITRRFHTNPTPPSHLQASTSAMTTMRATVTTTPATTTSSSTITLQHQTLFNSHPAHFARPNPQTHRTGNLTSTTSNALTPTCFSVNKFGPISTLPALSLTTQTDTVPPQPQDQTLTTPNTQPQTIWTIKGTADPSSSISDNNDSPEKSQAKSTFIKVPQRLREKLLLRNSMTYCAKSLIVVWSNHFFPPDIMGVMNITIDNIFRLFKITAALVKGYALGGITAYFLSVPMWEYTKQLFSVAVYPSLFIYFGITAYIAINFIHVGINVIADYPVIKQLVSFALQVRKLYTAPIQMIIRLFFRYAKEVKQANDIQKVEREKALIRDVEQVLKASGI